MNENNFNEPVNDTENEIIEEKEDIAEKETENNPVTFNEDGTYSSGYMKKEETPAHQNINTSYTGTQGYSENVNPYSVNSGSMNQNNTQRTYPYNPGVNQSSGSYPYGNQGGYPYGNSPYGNNPGGAYSYNPPPRQPGYAYNPETNKSGKSKGPKVFAIVAGVLCLFLVIALVSVVTGGNKKPATTNPEQTTENTMVEEFVTNSSPVTGNNQESDGQLIPKSIYQKVLPSSVGILVYDKSKKLASEGSGVLFQESTDGKYTYIVTCAHVINGSSGYIRVQLYDGKEYDAQTVGYDVRTDIGVIRIEKTGLTLAEVGDSSKIEVGDYIYAIGNPGGVEFANSFTNGIVSALDRPVSSSATDYTMECIQHTAAINPGNSGGALVNSFGQVVGINSMKIVADDYEGMGFAVPSSVFVEVVNEIMKHGYVSNRPKIGITIVPASEYSSYGMFVAIKGLPSGSLVIYEIAADSALNNTKAKAGDMIVAINGVDLESPSYLQEFVEGANVGDEITLSLIRINDDYSYEEFDVNVTLVEDRGDTPVVEEETTASSNFGGNYGGNYGGGSYDDYFEDYFKDFFGSYFGGYGN